MWIIGILFVLLIVIVVNAPRIYATFTYVNQAPELEADEYAVSGGMLSINLSEIDDLVEAGGAVTIVDDSLPSYILIAKVGENDYRVVSSECPHRGHAIGYIHEDSIFRCSSLGGESFDVDGNYRSGFVEENLTSYSFTVEDGIMIIDLSAG